MIKTIKEREQYNAPCCEEHILAVQAVIAQSPDEYNPGGTIEGSDGERE